MIIMITVQEAAKNLLDEIKQPLSSKELATLILDRKLVSSSAKDPVSSFAQTLERNIRMDSGNSPRLAFIQTNEGRKITLPEIDSIDFESNQTQDASTKITIKISQKLLEKINLINRIENSNNLEDTIIRLIKKGISSSTSDIINQLKNDFEDI